MQLRRKIFDGQIGRLSYGAPVSDRRASVLSAVHNAVVNRAAVGKGRARELGSPQEPKNTNASVAFKRHLQRWPKGRKSIQLAVEVATRSCSDAMVAERLSRRATKVRARIEYAASRRSFQRVRSSSASMSLSSNRTRPLSWMTSASICSGAIDLVSQRYWRFTSVLLIVEL